MQNILALWSRLSIGRRAVIIGATAPMFVAVLALARMAGQPEMALLYSGLDAAAAGEVIAALDRQGAAYEVRGDSISVEGAARDTLRMALAAEGLPATGPQGYEILEGLSGFGTTSQMFDAAFWRAREGELARTILVSPGVRSARVHIAVAPDQPFRQKSQPTASVTIQKASGAVTEAEARAIRHLVAAAIGSMRPEDVAVIDAVTGLVGATGEDAPGGDAAGRAQVLKENAERLLAARVGPGRAIVEVSLDLIAETEQISERRIDPQGRVAISSDTQEKTGRSSNGEEQGVTVASNLPEGDAAAGTTSQSQESETRERVNYEVSETTREVARAAGGIRRMTVAVLVDGLHKTDADGNLLQEPRSDTELQDLRDLVASAVGFDAARGDVLTLKSMDFEPAGVAGTMAEVGAALAVPLDLTLMLQMALLAAVALVLGLFLVRPVLLGAGRQAALAGAAPLALPNAHVPAAEGTRVLDGEIDDGGDLTGLPIVSTDAVEVSEDPVERLRRLIDRRQAESMEILRGWLNPEEEQA